MFKNLATAALVLVVVLSLCSNAGAQYYRQPGASEPLSFLRGPTPTFSSRHWPQPKSVFITTGSTDKEVSAKGKREDEEAIKRRFLAKKIFIEGYKEFLRERYKFQYEHGKIGVVLTQELWLQSLEKKQSAGVRRDLWRLDMEAELALLRAKLHMDVELACPGASVRDLPNGIWS